MRAITVNEEHISNPSNYVSGNDPHRAFDAARRIILEEIGNHISSELLAHPGLMSTEALMELLTPKEEETENFNEDSWKEIFVEDYLEPIISALTVVHEKVNDLKRLEGVGDLDFKTKKLSGMQNLRSKLGI